VCDPVHYTVRELGADVFLTLAFVLATDPTLTVVNLCPPALTVTSHCPPVVAKAEPIRTGYPVHATRWTYPGEIHSHLKSGQHAGKWPAWWVDTLTRCRSRRASRLVVRSKVRTR
jgi:hypothetical protein